MLEARRLINQNKARKLARSSTTKNIKEYLPQPRRILSSVYILDKIKKQKIKTQSGNTPCNVD